MGILNHQRQSTQVEPPRPRARDNHYLRQYNDNGCSYDDNHLGQRSPPQGNSEGHLRQPVDGDRWGRRD